MRKALSIKTLLQGYISLSKCFYISLSSPKRPDLSAHRDGDIKHGAGVPVVGADGSLVQVDDLLGQRKADAGFSAFSHVKAVEDVGKIFLGDAVPVVLYPYRHMTLVHATGQAQLAAGLAHAVGQDIGDRSAQPGIIAADHNGLLGEIRHDCDAAGGCRLHGAYAVV